MKILSLLSLFIVVCNAYAFSWADLWATKDQQAQTLMNKGQFKEAAARFQQQEWHAAAAYRAGDYAQAAKQYQSQKNESGYYNYANALAHLKQYEQAIKAYDKALAINPNNKDALYNRKLIEELLKNKKKQSNDQGNKNQDKDQQGKDQQGKDQQGKDQQGKDQQGKDQQGKDQQGKDQQGKDQQG
ncbi:tetratricopeptide repeat protein, partial [Legionella fairfieldensis]